MIFFWNFFLIFFIKFQKYLKPQEPVISINKQNLFYIIKNNIKEGMTYLNK